MGAPWPSSFCPSYPHTLTPLFQWAHLQQIFTYALPIITIQPQQSISKESVPLSPHFQLVPSTRQIPNTGYIPQPPLPFLSRHTSIQDIEMAPGTLLQFLETSTTKSSEVINVASPTSRK